MSQQHELERLFVKGTISRREFIARATAFGLTAALSPALFSGAARAAEPQKGGRFRLGLAQGATSDSLDIGKLPSTAPQVLHFQLRNCLVELDHNYVPIPELAESWESSPDAATWTFKLRKGVTFHNGKSFEAEDALYSINYHRGEKSQSAAKPLLNAITELKSDGKHTVVFKLSGGNADFPMIMSDYHLAMVPDGTKDFEKGIGTGAFELVQWEPGVRALSKRNPNYWKKGRGHFNEVETVYIADVTARTAALKTGEIDAMNLCERKTFHLLEKVPGLKGLNISGTTHYTIPMLCDVAPFYDNNVRMGLKFAIDREKLVKQVLRGYGAVGNDHPIAPNMRYFASDLPQREYDPEKARYYIKKAGLLDHTFKLHVADAAFAGAIDTAVLYREYASKAGIDIQVVQEPGDGYWSNVWMQKPWCFSFWGGEPSEDWKLSVGYASGAPWNESHFEHKRFNELLIAARAELDEAKRREMYAEMQRILRDEGGSVVPMFANLLMAASDKVGFKNVTGIEMDGLRACERWYFI